MPLKRKYTTELMVVALVYGYVLVRPQELRLVDLPRADETYLYLIGSRPRVTIDPASAMYFDGEIRVDGRLPIKERTQDFRATIMHALGPRVFIESKYPFDNYAFRRFGEPPLATGVVANMPLGRGVVGIPAAADNFNVLYVGQAYGKEGERSSVQRLKSHSTLLRILADATPDVQIWLALCRIDDLTLMATMNGIEDGQVAGKDDAEHYASALRWLNSRGPDRHEAVSLAEACLIRYFKPSYNIQLKNSFPQPQHAVLTALAELDLHSVAVELQMQDLEMLVGNNNVQHARWHAQMFETHFDPRRGPILDLLRPPRGAPKSTDTGPVAGKPLRRGDC